MQAQPVYFDNIASAYDEQLPAHIREFLLEKKTRLTVEALKKYGVLSGRGIDFGCGTGWYVRHIAGFGYTMVGLDNSTLIIDEAKKNNSGSNSLLRVGNFTDLAFAAESFDFVYCINSLHHLRDDDQVLRALNEAKRILRKDGLLIVHELNTFFLFKLYLNYLFPLTCKIDKFGGENWIDPEKLRRQNIFTLKEMHYYTFFPHIIPKFLFGFFCRINSFMERISLRKFGVHYMAVLQK